MKTLILLILASSLCLAGRWKDGDDDLELNYLADLPTCRLNSELRKSTHMDLRVRIASQDPEWNEAARKALAFWSTVVDMTWVEVHRSDCSMAIHDAPVGFLNASDTPQCDMNIAEAQFPQWKSFGGFILIEPLYEDSREHKFFTMVHEIGHVLALEHNEVDADSIMAPDGFEAQMYLTPSDMKQLKIKHVLLPAVASTEKIVIQYRLRHPSACEAHQVGGNEHGKSVCQ